MDRPRKTICKDINKISYKDALKKAGPSYKKSK
jgi:hypothetical protein